VPRLQSLWIPHKVARRVTNEIAERIHGAVPFYNDLDRLNAQGRRSNYRLI
jgi:hypothetical protein